MPKESYEDMRTYHVEVITHPDRLPELPSDNFFHSAQLFSVLYDTPGVKPFMTVAYDEKHTVRGHMLGIMMRRLMLLPPFMYHQAHVYGEGVYADEGEKPLVFKAMLHQVTRFLRHRLCLNIEFSDISRKMFGYKAFREEGYFPVSWMHIHNSLHSMNPYDRLDKRMKARIKKGYAQGVETRAVADDAELHSFYKSLRGYFRLKPTRYIPKEQFFKSVHRLGNGHIYGTFYKHTCIGGSAVIYSEGNAYLWYVCSRMKSFTLLHPRLLTVWHVINQAYQDGMQHIFFMNVGLPFKRNRYRDFLLSFGGKPVSTYRWFRCNISWVNKLLSWWYRE